MKLTPTDIDIIDLTLPRIYLPGEALMLRIKKDDLKSASIRNMLRVIKRSVQFLAFKYNCNQGDIYRLALNWALPHLYSLPGVSKIKETRAFIIEHAKEDEDVRVFENRFFDLKSTNTTRYSGWFSQKDLNQAGELADVLSLTKSLVYQIGFIYSLLHIEVIPAAAYNQMGEVFIRFRSDISRWARQETKQALRIKQECENKLPINDYKIPLEEVLGYE